MHFAKKHCYISVQQLLYAALVMDNTRFKEKQNRRGAAGDIFLGYFKVDTNEYLDFYLLEQEAITISKPALQ